VTQFACSNNIGNWNNGFQTFSLSDVPSGYVLSEVSVNLTGTFNCLNQNSLSLVNVTINGVVIDTKSVSGGSGCTCNSCDGVRSFSNKFYAFGFPGKFSGASNYMQVISVLSPICLSSADLMMTFYKPASDQKAITFNIWPVPNNTVEAGNCHACMFNNGSAQSSPYYVFFGFKDPLPAGKTAVAMSARVYGRWNYLSGNSNAGVKLTIADQAVDTRVIPGSVNNQCDFCGGGVDWKSTTYMFGWPNYSYGGYIKGSLYQSYTSSPYVVGMITITIIYI
jgi:hypothetical protein